MQHSESWSVSRPYFFGQSIHSENFRYHLCVHGSPKFHLKIWWYSCLSIIFYMYLFFPYNYISYVLNLKTSSVHSISLFVKAQSSHILLSLWNCSYPQLLLLLSHTSIIHDLRGEGDTSSNLHSILLTYIHPLYSVWMSDLAYQRQVRLLVPGLTPIPVHCCKQASKDIIWSVQARMVPSVA